MVLHRLERGDRPAELLPDLGVLCRLLGDLAGDAGRLGGEQQPGQVREHLAGPGQHRGRRAGEGHPRDPPGRVQVGRDLRLDPAARGLDDEHVVALGHEQHVGEVPARRDPGVAGAVGHVTAERHGPDRRAAGQAGEKPGLQVRRAGRRDHRARDHRRHERPRSHGAAELLDDDHQLGQAEAGSAVLLGQVQPEPAELAHLAPEVGQPVGLGLEQVPGGGAGAARGEELGDGLGQRPVVIGDRDRHD